jgi:thermitase
MAELDHCSVELPVPDKCCVGPCDPPWRSDRECMYWYETKFFRIPLRARDNAAPVETFAAVLPYIEFRIIYQHRLCLLGKQHGALLYTVTLLPGEKLTLYHSDRYRRTTTDENRYSVQTTFMQFASAVHQARQTNTLSTLVDHLMNTKANASISVGGGLAGLLGGPSGGTSLQINTTDQTQVQTGFVSEQFNQSVTQASMLTHAERSEVVSTYEDKQTTDITSRIIENKNECRSVTYFVRKVVELYAVSTVVFEISFRIVAPNVPSDWHSLNDIGWLPQPIQTEIKNAIKLLPKVGDVVDQERPISIPTDGVVYDPELAHCASCEPEREAASMLALEKQKAESMKACLEVQLLELELERRRKLLDAGELTPFDPAPAPAPAP